MHDYLTNVIEYADPKEAFANPQGSTGAVRAHEWEHWRNNSMGAIPLAVKLIKELPRQFTFDREKLYRNDPEEHKAYNREGMYVRDVLEGNLMK